MEMNSQFQALGQGSLSLEARILKAILRYFGNPPVELMLDCSGERVLPDVSIPPVVRIRIPDRRTLMYLLLDPQIRFGDAYASGRIQVEGDLVELMSGVYRATASRNAPIVRKIERWLRRPHRNTLLGSRENIHAHYDLSNDFYRLMLDPPDMTYTCAYFPTWDATLEQAQRAKIDHIARKLRLQPGETVLDVGCGWGAMALHFAEHYGVRVYGFSISRQQIEYARERAKARKLDARVEFILDDYRAILDYARDAGLKFDAVVSVGMLEHVGLENYPQYGGIIRNVLSDRGRGLIHAIGRNRPEPTHPWIEKRIFPGCYLPSLGEMMRIFESGGFHEAQGVELKVLDVENIGPHYAPTLRHWWQRYEGSIDKVRAMFGEAFARQRRLYLAGSIAAFEIGRLQLFHVLFAAQRYQVPSTRDYMYVTR